MHSKRWSRSEAGAMNPYSWTQSLPSPLNKYTSGMLNTEMHTVWLWVWVILGKPGTRKKLSEISHMNAFPVRNAVLGQHKLFVKVYWIWPIEIYLVSTWGNFLWPFFVAATEQKKILFKQLYFLAHISHTDSLSGTVSVFLFSYYERIFLNLSYMFIINLSPHPCIYSI